MKTVDPAAAIARAAEDLYVVAAELVAACEALAPLAGALDHADRRHRAACSLAGISCHRPPAREHAAALVLGPLAALAPFVPMVANASAEHAREQLLEFAADGED